MKYSRIKVWAKEVKSWESSNLTQSEYCRRRNMKPSTFRGWKKAVQEKSELESQVSIVQLKMPDQLSNPKQAIFTPITIENEIGKINISDNFNPETLKKVLQVIGEVKC